MFSAKFSFGFSVAFVSFYRVVEASVLLDYGARIILLGNVSAVAATLLGCNVSLSPSLPVAYRASTSAEVVGYFGCNTSVLLVKYSVRAALLYQRWQSAP